MRQLSEDAGDSDYAQSSENDSIFDESEDEGFLSDSATDLDLDASTDGADLKDNSGGDDGIEVRLFDGNAHPPEYYRKSYQDFNKEELDVDDYAAGVEQTLATMEAHWVQFCAVILKQDAQQCFATVSPAMLYNFLDWRLNQKEGKNGRKMKGTKKKASLVTYWDDFRLVFERSQGAKLDPKINRAMHKGLRKLAKKHGLSSEKRQNRCMSINELKEHNETTVSTTKKSFGLGELRILAVLFNLLIAAPGARPRAILRLRFRDLIIVLFRDPEGGPHKQLLKFTPEFTKTYLGAKDTKTHTVPETIGDPSLLLSPHVFLLGILFRHRAFRARGLVSPQQLEKLTIHPGELELRLPLRQDLDNVWVFRKAVKTLTGFEISMTEPITYAMMAMWMRCVGEIMGLQYPTIPYSLRYNAANEFDQDPNVSSATRNLTLDHASSDPFQKHYLGRLIPLDLWGIQRGQKPQHAIVKQSCTVGHSISKRRPIALTSEQAASVVTHPNIKRLEKQLQNLLPRTGAYQDIRKKIRSEKERLKRALKQSIRDDWTDEQAVRDIESQIEGRGFPAVVSQIALLPRRPAQTRLVEALTAPDDGTLDGYYRRKCVAIDAVSAYCTIEEGRTIRQRTSRMPAVKDKNRLPRRGCDSSGDSGDPVSQAMLSIFIQSEKDRPRQCFLCIGAAQVRERDDPQLAELLHEFYSASDLTKHFRRRHLGLIKENDRPECQVCELTLDDKMHLQNHAKRVHGTVS